MQVTVIIDGEKTPIKIVQYKDCTRVEFADGMPFVDSIDPDAIRIEDGVLNLSTLPGWGNNTVQELRWEISL